MPAYDYHCPACNSTYELRQGFDASTTHTCEECGKGVAKRVLTPPTVVFKGTGWYATDSRKSTTATSEGGDTSTPKESAAEAKPEKAASAPAASAEGASAAAAS